MTTIFISYSSKNSPEIEALALDIASLGHDVWFDKELIGGHVWWESILKEIRQREVFLFALSQDSLDSYPCRLEYGYAHALHKNIFPVLVSGTISPNLLPPELVTIQYVDYRQRNADAAIRLARALALLPAPVALPDPLPSSPDVPISQIGLLRERIESRETLNFEQQAGLIFQLKEELLNPAYRADVLELLRRMQRRDDLLARIGREIEGILVESNTPLKAQPIPATTISVTKQQEAATPKAKPATTAAPPPRRIETKVEKAPVTVSEEAVFTVDNLMPNWRLMLASAVVWAFCLYLAHDIELNIIGGWGYNEGNLLAQGLYIGLPWFFQGLLTGYFFNRQNRLAQPLSIRDWVINGLLGGPLSIFQIQREHKNLRSWHYALWSAIVFILLMGSLTVFWSLYHVLHGNRLYPAFGYEVRHMDALAASLIIAGIFIGGIGAYVLGFITKITTSQKR